MKRFLIFFFCPLTLTGIYDLIFYFPNTWAGKYSDLGTIFPFYLSLQVVLFLFLSLYLIHKYSKNSSLDAYSPPQKGMSILIYFLIIGICIFLYLFLFMSVFGEINFSYLITRNAYFYAKSKVGTAWVFFLYQFFVMLMLYDFYRNGISKLKGLVFLFCVLLIATTGGRSTIILWLCLIVYIHVVVHGNKIGLMYRYLGFTLVVFIFSANAILRSGSSENFSDYFSGGGFILDFDNAFVLQDSIDYVDRNSDHYGVALNDLVYTFVPRSLYPEKPVSTAETRLVYKDMLSDGRTTNITFGIYGNLVINLGYLGLAVAPFLVIWLSVFYYRIIQRLPLKKPSTFIILYFFITYLYVLRGGFINIRIVMALTVLFMAVSCYEILRRIKFKKTSIK